MTWALSFQNTTCIVYNTPIVIDSDTEFAITYHFIYKNGEEQTLDGVSTSYKNNLMIMQNGGACRIRFSGSNRTMTLNNALVVDNEYVLSIKRDDSNNVGIYDENDVLISTTVNESAGATLVSFGKQSIQDRNFVSELISRSFYGDFSRTTLMQKLDPAASDHSATDVYLVDTVGSNDAQGINFNNDGSDWVNTSVSNLIDLDFANSIIGITSDSLTIAKTTNLSFADSVIDISTSAMTINKVTSLNFASSVVQITSDALTLLKDKAYVFDFNYLTLYDVTPRIYLTDLTN